MASDYWTSKKRAVGELSTVTLTTTATVPASTSVTITLFEDVNADESGANTDALGNAYDNSDTITLSGGSDESNDLTGFDGNANQNDYWCHIQLDGDGSDPTVAAPTIDSVDVKVEADDVTALMDLAVSTTSAPEPTTASNITVGAQPASTSTAATSPAMWNVAESEFWSSKKLATGDLSTIPLTTTTTIPEGASVVITLFEDVWAEGNGPHTDALGNAYSNSATVTLSGGIEETNYLTGFEGSGSQNDYWCHVRLLGDGSDPTVPTPTIDSIDAQVTADDETIALSIASVTSDGLEPTVDATAIVGANPASTSSSSIDLTTSQGLVSVTANPSPVGTAVNDPAINGVYQTAADVADSSITANSVTATPSVTATATPSSTTTTAVSPSLLGVAYSEFWTPKKQAAGDSSAITLTTTTTIPSGASIIATLYEDVGADGSGSNTDAIGNSYDNAATVTLSGGTDETNEITGFAGSGTTNDYWCHFRLLGDGTDPTLASPTIDSVAMEAAETITLDVSAVEAGAPEATTITTVTIGANPASSISSTMDPSSSPGGVTASTPAIPLTSSGVSSAASPGVTAASGDVATHTSSALDSGAVPGTVAPTAGVGDVRATALGLGSGSLFQATADVASNSISATPVVTSALANASMAPSSVTTNALGATPAIQTLINADYAISTLSTENPGIDAGERLVPVPPSMGISESVSPSISPGVVSSDVEATSLQSEAFDLTAASVVTALASPSITSADGVGPALSSSGVLAVGDVSTAAPLAISPIAKEGTVASAASPAGAFADGIETTVGVTGISASGDIASVGTVTLSPEMLSYVVANADFATLTADGISFISSPDTLVADVAVISVDLDVLDPDIFVSALAAMDGADVLSDVLTPTTSAVNNPGADIADITSSATSLSATPFGVTAEANVSQLSATANIPFIQTIKIDESEHIIYLDGIWWVSREVDGEKRNTVHIDGTIDR